MKSSTGNAPNDSRERCFHIVSRIFDIPSAKPEDTKFFRTVTHEEACEAFRYWLEQMRIVLAEPVNITITQSLRDDGIDVLLAFLKSKVKFGFQIKSYNDIREKDFTKSTIAQIERSRKHGVYRFFLAFCADLTDDSQREKVRGLTSEISEMGDYCHVFSPEKTLRIVKVFKEKQHPISLIEGMGQVLVILSALQKKLADDPHYTPELSLTYKLKNRLDEKQHPVKFNLTVKHPKGVTKTLWDTLKEIQLTGKPATIPGDDIEKFEVFMGTQRLIPEGTKLKYLTITPEKPKLPPVFIETIDHEDGSPITFENQIFAKSQMIYLIREARHMGIALGLDSVRFYAIDIDIRNLADYMILKAQGVQGLAKDLKWLYSYFNPSTIRNMKPQNFFIITRKGALGLGEFPFQEWHKREKEDILKAVGIKVEYGEELNEGEYRGTFRTVSDREHAEMIRLHLVDGLSYEKIAERFSRSSRTPLLHIQKRNQAILKSGFCPSCKKVKNKLESILADKS